jgi:hypothetical protein
MVRTDPGALSETTVARIDRRGNPSQGNRICGSDLPELKMLIVGAGVIGTVYGAHIAAAGNKVPVLQDSERTMVTLRSGVSPRSVRDLNALSPARTGGCGTQLSSCLAGCG